MSELITIRVATTPVHAKLIVALLESEGIPATVEGDLLSDQVAISRRLLNTAGTQVKVRTEDLERAREVLAAAAEAVDDAELEKQALAATEPEQSPRPEADAADSPARWPYVLVGAFLGGIGVWMLRDATSAAAADPHFVAEPTADGVRLVWKADPRHYLDYVDADGDGSYERSVSHYLSGATYTSIDADGDGRYEQYTLQDPTGTAAQWTEGLDAEFTAEATVRDPGGAVLQRVRWVPHQGYVFLPL